MIKLPLFLHTLSDHTNWTYVGKLNSVDLIHGTLYVQCLDNHETIFVKMKTSAFSSWSQFSFVFTLISLDDLATVSSVPLEH